MRKLLSALLAVGLLAAVATTAQAASGGNSTLTVTAGSGLSISGAAPGNFAVTLNGSNQSATTTLATYQGLDTTGLGNGWNVTFQATQFTCTTGPCPGGGDLLPLNSLMIAPPTVACHVGTNCTGSSVAPTISIATNSAVDAATAVKVASAALQTGMGTYDFTPGAIGAGQLQLAVPSSAYASTYSSTLTVSINVGP